MSVLLGYPAHAHFTRRTVPTRKDNREPTPQAKQITPHSGISRTHISKLENGTKEAKLRTLEIIAIALETTLSDLFREMDAKP